MSWQELVEQHRLANGSLTGLADELIRRLRLEGADPPELGSVEKGLRRLAGRGHGAGGQYGRWLVRCFGVPSPIEARLRFISQYHSRFCDLPTSLRLEHLRLWDRPPVTESPGAAWIHVGMASALFRAGDEAKARERLEAARAATEQAPGLPRLEVDLLRARLLPDGSEALWPLFDAVEEGLERPGLPEDEVACYRARLHGQRAYAWLRRHPERLAEAREQFERLTEGLELPFVAYRRTAGLAFCAWRGGDPVEGRRLVRLAAEHAGDGGFIRFRVMALNLESRMGADEDEARGLRARAARLARSIEDTHLERVATRYA